MLSSTECHGLYYRCALPQHSLDGGDGVVQVDGRRPDVKVNAQVSLNVDVGAMEHVVPSARVTVSPVVDVHVVRLPREVSVVVEDQGAAVVVRLRPVGVVRRGNVETGRHTTVSVKVDVVHRGVPGA